MKKATVKKLTAAACFVLLMCSIFVLSSAEQSVDLLIEQCVEQQVKKHAAHSAQSLVDGYVTDYAGCGSDWLALSLMRYGEWDFTAYRSELEEYVQENTIENAVSRQRCALMLIACGSDSSFISETADNSIGENGIMSFVYGLHLLTNGAESRHFTKQQLIDELLALSLDDGGWALGATGSDVDVTAMVLQSLSPYYGELECVRTAVDTAVEMLSRRQLDNGDFSSYGVPNPESTAQVAVALSSLGIDALADSRFIKNSNTLLDGMLRYRLENGGFSHSEGGAENTLAGEQVLCALVSIYRYENSQEPFYVFKEKEIPPKADTETFSQPTETENFLPAVEETFTTLHSTQAAEQIEKEEIKSSLFYEKEIIITVIIVLAALAAVYFAAIRKNKRCAAVITAAALVASAAVTLQIQSKEDFYSSAEKNGEITVVLSVTCHTAAEKGEASHIPESGIILPETLLSLEDNSTVLDALMLASKKYGLLIENDSASPVTAYISGINNLYESDFGELSGWMYFVNGKSPDKGCGEYLLENGDTVEWCYTCNLGDDLK